MVDGFWMLCIQCNVDCINCKIRSTSVTPWLLDQNNLEQPPSIITTLNYHFKALDSSMYGSKVMSKGDFFQGVQTVWSSSLK